MRRVAIGKVWLALLVLLATLASAPLGSVEQGRPGWNGHAGLEPTCLAARSAGGAGLVEKVASVPGRPDPLRGDRTLYPPTPAIHPEQRGGAIRCPAPDGRAACCVVPTCERLPYDANAPPSFG